MTALASDGQGQRLDPVGEAKLILGMPLRELKEAIVRLTVMTTALFRSKQQQGPYLKWVSISEYPALCAYM